MNLYHSVLQWLKHPSHQRLVTLIGMIVVTLVVVAVVFGVYLLLNR